MTQTMECRGLWTGHFVRCYINLLWIFLMLDKSLSGSFMLIMQWLDKTMMIIIIIDNNDDDDNRLSGSLMLNMHWLDKMMMIILMMINDDVVDYDDDDVDDDDDDDDDDNRVSGSLMLSMQWLDKMCGVTPTSKDSTPSTTRQQPQEDICQPL